MPFLFLKYPAFVDQDIYINNNKKNKINLNKLKKNKRNEWMNMLTSKFIS